MANNKKPFQDRIIGEAEVKPDGSTTAKINGVVYHDVPLSEYQYLVRMQNDVMRKKDSITTKERAVTSSTNAPQPQTYTTLAYPAAGVPAGDSESSVQITSSGSPEAGVETPIEGTARGITDDMGNYISIQSDGSLLLSHISGASVSIKPDGAIYVAAMGNKGINLVSGKGGIGIHSQGQIVFDAQGPIVMSSKASVGIHSAGGNPITLDAGGDLNTKAGGSSTRLVTGTDYSFVGGSKAEMVFGNADYQVQGVSKIGSTTQLQMDSPKTNVGASEQLVLNSEGVGGFYTKNDMALQAKGYLQASSKGGAAIMSEADVTIAGDEGVLMSSVKNAAIRGKNVNLDALEVMSLDSKQDIDLQAPDITLHATGNLELAGQDSTKLSSKSTLDIDSNGAMNLAGSTIDLNSRAKNPTTPRPNRTTSPSGGIKTSSVEDHFKEDKFEADNFLTKEQFEGMNQNYQASKDGFPYSDYTMSGDDYNALKNNGGQLPSGAEQNASQKQSSGSQISDGESYGTINSGASENYSVAREVDMPPPTSSNPQDPVGSYSLEGIPGVENIPGDGQSGVDRATIVKNLMHLNENIVLPLIANHPDVRAARGFLLKYDNSDNPHYKGLAIDFIVGNRNNYPRLVQVAFWASRKLPCKVIRIEKTLTHSYIHIEAAEAGQTGQNCTVETCNDIEGKSKTAGLVLKTNEYKDAQLSTRSKDKNKKPTWVDES